VQERVGNTLEHIGIGDDLNSTPIAQQMKRKDWQMWLHETKKLLQNKGNGHLTEEATHSMGENLCQLYIWQGINNQSVQGAKKIKLPMNQWPSEEMGKWTEQKIFKQRSINDKKHTQRKAQHPLP
jgi:hypothetical protein